MQENIFHEVITELERRRSVIDKAIGALKEYELGGMGAQGFTARDIDHLAGEPKAPTSLPSKTKHHLSAEGRRAISRAAKKRWAAAKRLAA